MLLALIGVDLQAREGQIAALAAQRLDDVEPRWVVRDIEDERARRCVERFACRRRIHPADGTGGIGNG